MWKHADSVENDQLKWIKYLPMVLVCVELSLQLYLFMVVFLPCIHLIQLNLMFVNDIIMRFFCCIRSLSLFVLFNCNCMHKNLIWFLSRGFHTNTHKKKMGRLIQMVIKWHLYWNDMDEWNPYVRISMRFLQNEIWRKRWIIEINMLINCITCPCSWISAAFYELWQTHKTDSHAIFYSFIVSSSSKQMLQSSNN